jgi:tRNA-specific 2-thiouridylase
MILTKKNISGNNKRVLVGISGGVDSSVSAILLKKQGYDVEGVFAKVWQPDFTPCTWRDEMKDAMRVCARLDIPFHFLDLEHEYKALVGDYMISEYKAGRTPNPDVMCNTHIKFGLIYDFAIRNGFDFVATGHYARNEGGQLKRGSDANKDQSYFLWNVPKDRFDRILFPVGHLTKPEVRKVARQHSLFTSQKKDSQGLCFIGQVDMKAFLKNLIEVSPGDVINQSGEIIGAHEGARLYTVGERHGFTIEPRHKGTHDKPLFVIDKDIALNTLTVSDTAPAVTQVLMCDVNKLGHHFPTEALVQFRYRQKPIRAHIKEDSGMCTLIIEGYVDSIATGQSAVLYHDDVCLGGGIVDKVIY